MNVLKTRNLVVFTTLLMIVLLVLVIHMKEQRESTSPGVSNLLQQIASKLNVRNQIIEVPTQVHEYRETIDNYGAKVYIQEIGKLLPNQSQNLLQGVDPNNPNTIKEWWQAAGMINWFYNTPFRYICLKKMMFGNWFVCQDEAVRIKPPCLVYSFGINNQFSFDDAFAKLGCEVHSFDPSMGVQDHKRSENVTFHNLGIGHVDDDGYEARRDGYVRNRQVWKMRTASSIKHMLGHDHRVIDVFKMDIEGYEWSVVEQMMDSGIFRSIPQFIMEFHLFNLFPPREKYIQLYNVYRRLREMGMQEFNHRKGPMRLELRRFTMQRDVGFINAEYLKRNPK